MGVMTTGPRRAPRSRNQRRNVNLGGTERLVSLLGGGTLTYLGWRRRGALGTAMMTAGGVLALRGMTGHSMAYDALGLAPDAAERRIAAEYGWSRAVRVVQCVTIDRSRGELYHFWRNFANLPRFMRHVERITVLSDRLSHWVVRAPAGRTPAGRTPAGRTVEWDAEIEDERENEWIRWRSLPGGDIRNAGVVEFRDAPGKRGTEVTVRFSYEPPLGEVGQLLAKLSGESPSRQAADDLRRFKQLMEAGEIATIEGQPSASRQPARRVRTASRFRAA